MLPLIILSPESQLMQNLVKNLFTHLQHYLIGIYFNLFEKIWSGKIKK